MRIESCDILLKRHGDYDDNNCRASAGSCQGDDDGKSSYGEGRGRQKVMMAPCEVQVACR